MLAVKNNHFRTCKLYKFIPLIEKPIKKLFTLYQNNLQVQFRSIQTKPFLYKSIIHVVKEKSLSEIEIGVSYF